MKEILNTLFEYRTLSEGQAKEVLINLAKGEYNASQMASFLTVYMMRSITVEELSGFRKAMMELCVPINLAEFDPIDLCGTGGDGKNTFNISTLSSFVVAGAGVKVAKHGNNGVSSACGSSNLLDHLGYEFTNDESTLKKQIDEAGICFLHAPLFHPAMKNVAPVRKDLGVKTFFNMLGPMVNPSSPKKQLTGVFSLELARLYAYLFQQTDKDFVVLHALDGYDEISLTGDFKAITNTGESIISPKQLGLNKVDAKQIYGGETVETSAKIFIDILEGNGTEAQKEVVLANSAMALKCADDKLSDADAIGKAKESLESGNAYSVLKKLVA
ncbi:anthranilate phosphoribosyltransferase [Mangrovivirga cuniculi]|uniref:Anthranilate phosphoribosyltransferase n=1 Tax=Mangrovivirga cuniculi TaxID=2715131 RepID=A0A4D7JK83_9BACT|nr:anthranilate phosphoribosyltransferase [Mangrovivirga cuniculi]QCK16011.1 anthranilate phosphoribosyltransferase [Mangrovivirga cuniculi]